MSKSVFEMERTNVMVEFNIIGDIFDTDIITHRLSIQPNEHWMKGDKVKDKDIERVDTCWTVHTEYEESIDINEQLKKILNILIPKLNELKEVQSAYNLEYRFCIIINIENNEKPAMYINGEMIKFVYEINAEIDFDLYIYS